MEIRFCFSPHAALGVSVYFFSFEPLQSQILGLILDSSLKEITFLVFISEVFESLITSNFFLFSVIHNDRFSFDRILRRVVRMVHIH